VRILRREAASRAAVAREASAREGVARGRETPARESAARRVPVGFGVGYDQDYADYHLPRPPRGGGFFAKLFKVLLVALLLGGIGVGAIIYLDPDGAGRRFREHAHRAWAWTKAKFEKSGSHGTAPSSRPDSQPSVFSPAGADTGTAARIPADPVPSTQNTTAPAEDFSRLTPQQAKYKVYELWEAGEAASVRGEHKKAVALWESIKRLPGVKEEDWPLGLSARIEMVKKKIK
jgi:hypothetical protein